MELTKRIKELEERLRFLELENQQLQKNIALANPLDVTAVKEKEIELMNSEARYKALSNATNEAVWFSVDALCVDFNHSALKMFGYTAKEIVGTHALSIIDEAYRAETIRHLKENYLEPYFSMGLHKDGHSFPIQIQGRVFDYNGQKTRITTMRDISDSKANETALLNSEARFKALAEAASDGVFIMENGKCIDLNTRALEIYGYSHNEAIGMPVLDFIAPESRKLVSKKFSLEYAPAYEGWGIRKNGDVFAAELRGKNFVYTGRKVRISTVRDISVQKQVELKLASSEAKFRANFEENTAIKLQFDSKTKQITDANKAAVAFYGYTKEELITKSIYNVNLLPAEEVDRLVLKAVNNEQNIFSFSHRLKNGASRDVQVYVSPIEVDGRTSLLSIIHDITEGKKAEEELRKSEARFRAYFENNSAAMLQIDPQSKQILNANKMALLFYGYNQSQIQNLKIYDINILSKAEIDQRLKQAMDFTERKFISNHRLSSGAECEVEVYFSPINIESEQRLFITVYDVSERESNKRALEESKTQLALINQHLEIKVKEELAKSREKDHLIIQQSRHVVLGEMIGNIAHQWRQPLNDISVLINDLEDAFGFGVLTKDYFNNTIEIVFRRLKFMSDTINDFSIMHTDDFKKETFQPKILIEKLILFAAGLISKSNIQIQLVCHKDFEVYGYPNMLSHVMLNLLNNSHDILVERKIKKPKIWIKIKKKADHFSIQILDNGKGVEMEVIDKIFDPYFTTKDQRKGSGLGLYMVKSIVEKQMHGQIEVKNQPEGAEFKISLDLKIKDL